jgi:hypothetical protein
MPFTLAQKRKILEKQNMTCGLCQRKITLTAYRLRDWKKILGYYPDKSVPSQAKFHHKKWRSCGGSDETINGIALCGFCHTHKAHKPFQVIGI